jgi:hypothetical protein
VFSAAKQTAPSDKLLNSAALRRKLKEKSGFRSAECCSHQSPQASALYTKVAKSAKKELETVNFFAIFATLV